MKKVVSISGILVSHNAYGYNQAGQLIWEEAASRAKSLYFYTPEGELSHKTIALGRVTENKYDAKGRPTQTIEADGTISVYEYDGKDNIRNR